MANDIGEIIEDLDAEKKKKKNRNYNDKKFINNFSGLRKIVHEMVLLS